MGLEIDGFSLALSVDLKGKNITKNSYFYWGIQFEKIKIEKKSFSCFAAYIYCKFGGIRK